MYGQARGAGYQSLTPSSSAVASLPKSSAKHRVWPAYALRDFVAFVLLSRNRSSLALQAPGMVKNIFHVSSCATTSV